MFLNSEKKPWKNLTDEEKGKLLLAHHESKTIEQYITENELPGGWYARSFPNFDVESSIFRVKPEPKVEQIKLVWSKQGFIYDHDFVITFNLVDGEPDCSSIKMTKF